ncbi:Hypothetical predicted protein [Cloeon dipterum]|uniref:Uncharacterized protein n=1 Tax=Cloeon dipterum TaxID=197152 RepID=A0A8S1DRQ3_9INSE|nr:Hypothetical predicted protein [Cloeon dipterum]
MYGMQFKSERNIEEGGSKNTSEDGNGTGKILDAIRSKCIEFKRQNKCEGKRRPTCEILLICAHKLQRRFEIMSKVVKKIEDGGIKYKSEGDDAAGRIFNTIKSKWTDLKRGEKQFQKEILSYLPCLLSQADSRKLKGKTINFFIICAQILQRRIEIMIQYQRLHEEEEEDNAAGGFFRNIRKTFTDITRIFEHRRKDDRRVHFQSRRKNSKDGSR